ncbi:hypothetical protein Daus18300_010079, partial [Diaporthe australafricana]
MDARTHAPPQQTRDYCRDVRDETLLELERLTVLPRERLARSMSPSGARTEAMSAAMLTKYLANTDEAPLPSQGSA